MRQVVADAAIGPAVRQRFEQALERFVERARQDPYLLAVILFGSLSHDVVWEKSDIDLMVITPDQKLSPAQKRAARTAVALVEDGVNIHGILQGRCDFKRLIDGSTQSSFMHSSFARSRLVFTRDESIRELYDEGIRRMGARDRQAQLLGAGSCVLGTFYKAQKWFHVRKDLDYTFYWIMSCLTYLAQIEVYLSSQIAGREVIQQAIELNPELFEAVYSGLINATKTRKTIGDALERIDTYLTRKKRTLFGPILEYLAEAGAPRSASEIDAHFADHFGVKSATMACEWLADKEVIAKVSVPVRITQRSAVEFEEMAFYYDGEESTHD